MHKKYPYLYSVTIVLIVWFLVSTLVAKRFIPNPYEVMIYFISDFNTLATHAMFSLYRIFIAISITLILGSFIGIISARNPRIDEYLSPILYTLYPVPKIAFLPLLMLLFGLGNTSKIILVGLILFFQITISIRDSVKNIHPMYFLAIKSLKASKLQVYHHVIIPAVLPNIFTALRISVGTSISVLFFAENFATEYGIGYYIMDHWMKLDYTAMFAGIVAISLLGTSLFTLIDIFEKIFCKWKIQSH